MELKLKEIFAVQTGLNNLDAYQKDGKPELYKLGGSVRLSIAKSQNRLKEVVEAFRAATNDLIKELSGGGTQVPPEKINEFNDQQAAMLEGEHEVDVKKLAVADLKLEENPIPASVLALLEPILTE